MSTGYAWFCTSCDDSPDDETDRALATLRELAPLGPGLRLMRESGAADLLSEVTVDHWQLSPQAFWWLSHHSGPEHVLEIRDEYGRVYQMKAACETPHGLLPIVCERSADHGGTHEAEWNISYDRVQHFASTVTWRYPLRGDRPGVLAALQPVRDRLEELGVIDPFETTDALREQSEMENTG